jgi:hypothetical protein
MCQEGDSHESNFNLLDLESVLLPQPDETKTPRTPDTIAEFFL